MVEHLPEIKQALASITALKKEKLTEIFSLVERESYSFKEHWQSHTGFRMKAVLSGVSLTAKWQVFMHTNSGSA